MNKAAAKRIGCDSQQNFESDCPEGWIMTNIGDIVELNPSKPPKDALPPETPVTFVPMPAIDAYDGKITTPDERPFGAVRNGYTAFRKNDVIFAKITPCMENGKSAVVPTLKNDLGFGSSEFHVLRPTGAVIPGYLFYYLRQEWFRRAAETEMTGSVGQKRVPAHFLKNALLPLAPLAEQKRIVAKVEELLIRGNVVRNRLAKVKEILTCFRKSVISAACSGHLTENWRNVHPNIESGQELIERILIERKRIWFEQRRKNGKNPKKSRYPIITKSNPDFGADLPTSWSISSMEGLSCHITSGSRAWKQYYSEEGPGTFIMGQNVRPFRLDLSNPVHVDPPTHNPDRERSEVRQDDILVTIAGNTGDVCRVIEAADRHYVCQSVALIRPVLGEIAEYLELYLNSPQHGQAQYREWIYGEGRPHLSFNHLRATAVLIPPLLEQKEIVRRAKELFKIADAIEKRVAEAGEGAERLTQAILVKAFRGELVPPEAELARREDRSFEPASLLLERIKRARKEVNPICKNTRKRGRRQGKA